jgi:hypothetical protein
VRQMVRLAVRLIRFAVQSKLLVQKNTRVLHCHVLGAMKETEQQ